MARGWESKAVETQIEESAGTEESDAGGVPQKESLELRRKREGLELHRSRILQEIETARNPRYRNMLDEMLNHIELELTGLSNK